ncbi:ATP-dependent helicase [Chloroflexota bacterium]
MDVLEGLNPAQREAVETIEGPLLILAGPGSGKTRVITHRIAYLVKQWRINPRRIIAVTFTNKAAREMKERLYRLLGRSVDELTVGTFHAISASILRREGKASGIDPRFVIYDEDDQISLVKRAMQELEIDPKRYPPKAFLATIGQAKSQLITPEAHEQTINSHFDEVAQRVYRQYQSLLDRNHALDFDDLLMRTYYLFHEHPNILSKYQSRYLHLLVDEFQDTNITQYALVKQLGGKYRNICVVGDPDQSIYSWRHADIRNILSFEKDYPEAKVVYLEQSYRSTKNILDAAHRVISVNRERKENKLRTENDIGEPVTMMTTCDEAEEAQFVVSQIEDLLNRLEARHADCAVMYRTNAQSRALEETFVRYGMPYQLVGGVRFYERREVKDIIAYLKLIHNPHDSISLMRIINVPPRGIGKKTLDELSQWTMNLGIPTYAGLEMITQDSASSPLASRSVQALTGFYNLLKELIEESQEVNVADLLDSVVRKTGYRDHILELDDGEDRWDNILELRGIAKDYENLSPAQGLASFLDGVSLFSDTDTFDEKKDLVTLITLHQAKGLEFPVVFIVGMEEGVLPHLRSFDDPAQMEEERRLCYVGMTRSKTRLYLVNASYRRLFGGMNANPPSRYLKDIPSDLTEATSLIEDEGKPQPTRPS